MCNSTCTIITQLFLIQLLCSWLHNTTRMLSYLRASRGVQQGWQEGWRAHSVGRGRGHPGHPVFRREAQLRPCSSLSRGCSQGTWQEVQEQHGVALEGVRLDIRKCFFTMRVVRHWQSLRSEVADAPCQAVSETCLGFNFQAPLRWSSSWIQ